MSIPDPDPAADSPRAPLVPPEAHTHGFRRTRQARRLELVEDYVELVADLIDDAGEARQIDIARRLGVAQPTVAKMLNRLVAEGLISRKPYRGVFLTEEGRRIAAASRDRHRIVETFLRDIGISPETARVDAEGIEHHVSAESLLAFKAFSDGKALAEGRALAEGKAVPDGGAAAGSGRGRRGKPGAG